MTAGKYYSLQYAAIEGTMRLSSRGKFYKGGQQMFIFSCNEGCNTGCYSIWQILSRICGGFGC